MTPLLAHVEAQENLNRSLGMDDGPFLHLAQESKTTPLRSCKSNWRRIFSSAEDWDLESLPSAEEAGDIAWDPK